MEVNKSIEKIHKRRQNNDFLLPPINKETNADLIDSNSILIKYIRETKMISLDILKKN